MVVNSNLYSCTVYEKYFGKGYNILAIWKQRLNAKTLVTTPNSDVIYAIGFLDLKENGPMVIEAPEGLQGTGQNSLFNNVLKGLTAVRTGFVSSPYRTIMRTLTYTRSIS